MAEKKKKSPRAAKPAKAAKVSPAVAVEAAPVVVEAAPVAVEAAPFAVEATPVVVEPAPVAVEPAPVGAAPLPDAAIERIRSRARALWEARGGSAFDNWLEAERAVRAEVQASA